MLPSPETMARHPNLCYNPLMAKKKTTKSNTATIGFEQQIWDAACELWGHIPAADYRKIFTGLIFLKYILIHILLKYLIGCF